MCITLMYFRYHRFLCYRLSRIQAFSGICLVITLHYPNRYGMIFRVELSLFSAAITIALSSLAMDSSSLGTPPSLSVASSFAPSDPLSGSSAFSTISSFHSSNPKSVSSSTGDGGKNRLPSAYFVMVNWSVISPLAPSSLL